jgi:hypothetical protein
MLGILQPGRIDNQGQSPESIRRGRIEDMKINPGNYGLGLQQPRPGMGLGFPGMKSLEEGMLFLPDKDNPRSEEDIQAQYKQAQLEAARQRREGFLGQVVLPGEMKYEDFKATNLYNFKRNPNLPDSAYTDFDMTGVAGFDNPTIDDASMKGLPETNEPPMQQPMNPFRKAVDVERGDSLKTGGIGSLQPYQPAYQNNMNQFKDFEKRLENIEQGVGSLLDKNQMYTSNNMGVQGYSSTGYSPNSVIGNLLRWSYR